MIFSEESVRWALLLICSSVVSIYLSAYAFQRRDVPGAAAFAFFTLTVSLYSLGYALELNGQTLERILEVMRFEVFWASFTAPAFFLFVFRFVFQKKGPDLLTLLLFTLPMVIGIVTLTDTHAENLYKSCVLLEGGDFPVIDYESGLWHKIQLAFLISLSLAAEILLFIHAFKVRGALRVQAFFLLAASLLPTSTAFLFPERSVGRNIDLLPFAFLVSVLLLSLVLFRFRMLDLPHAARNLALDNVRDGLMILDRNLVVRDINSTGQTMEILSPFRIGRELEKTSGAFACSLYGDFADGEGVHFFEEDERHYRYTVSSISNRRGGLDGYLLHLRDESSMINRMKDLENQAIRDELTGVYNRRYLIYRMERELAEAAERETPLSLIMFDLDHFKDVNDNYGHTTGDQVLVELARSVGRQLRHTETLGRYGGEEFCILCPQTNGREALGIAERLRRGVEDLLVRSGESDLKITASFGICSFLGRDILKPEVFLDRADMAMYSAKEQGRNRSVLYQD